MDVGDLLNFKPQFNVKHKLDGASGSDRSSTGSYPRKRSRLDVASKVYPPPPIREAVITQNTRLHLSGSHAPSKPTKTETDAALSEAQARLIEQKMEELDKKQDEGPLDENRVKKMVLNFDKKVLRNQELRIKFPEDPQRFMESEIELNEAIEELHVLATDPDLYSLIVELGSIKTLLGLLSHENTDIAIAVIDLLQEMTDIELENDSDGIDDLIAALTEGEVVAMLVYTLHRLDESNRRESEGVYHTLGIIENLAEIHPEFCDETVSGGLISWLLKRIKSKAPFDTNKLYASEILAICIQNNPTNQKSVGAIEGIDILLQQLAQYKRHDPSSEEEQEMMENLFDSLCSCLLHEANRDPFLNGEGLQLMNLMLREKKVSRNGALRVLDHALSGKEGMDNCNKFVDILGLRTLFPLFMKTPIKHGKKGLSKDQHEEHVVSIISWLLRNCKSSQRQRLLNKFTENDHEKVDRLLELHFKYLEKVLTTNSSLEEQAKADDLDEDELYIKRLDGGLFILQLVDFIMLDICAAGHPSIKRRVLKILNVRNASIKTIKNIIREYAGNLGETNESGKSEDQEIILTLLDKFQNS